MSVQVLRSVTPGRLAASPLLEGEFGLDMSTVPVSLWIGVASSVSSAGRVRLLPAATTGPTITGITTAAGSGLTGGGTSGTLSLAIAPNANLPGVPTAATAVAGTATTQLATTAFVENAVGSAGGGTVMSITAGSGLSGGIITTAGTISLDAGTALGVIGGAPINNPTFTGTARGPTPAATDNSTALATTAWVMDHVSAGAVASVAGTAPINASTTAGAVTVSLAASGVTATNYTNANITVDQFGRITTASNGTAGGVTSLTGTAPINASASIGSITVSLANSGVIAGPYTNANITIDALGRITTAANGSAGAGSSSALATNTGQLYVNINSAPTIPCSGAILQVTGADSGVNAATSLVIDAIGAPTIITRRGVGSIAASSTATPPAGNLANNAIIGQWDMRGYIGTGSIPFSPASCSIRGQTVETWSGASRGTKMEFWTTPIGNLVGQVILTITGTGGVVVGNVADPGVFGAFTAEQILVGGMDVEATLTSILTRLTAAGIP